MEEIAVAVIGIGVAEGEAVWMGEGDVHRLAGLAGMVEAQHAQLRARRARGSIGQDRIEVGKRGRRGVVFQRRRKEEGVGLFHIALEEGKGQCARDQRGQAEKRAGECNDDVEGQRPDAGPVVQVGLLQAFRSAQAHMEGILEDARVRHQAGNQQGEQRDAGHADQERSNKMR